MGNTQSWTQSNMLVPTRKGSEESSPRKGDRLSLLGPLGCCVDAWICPRTSRTALPSKPPSRPAGPVTPGSSGFGGVRVLWRCSKRVTAQHVFFFGPVSVIKGVSCKVGSWELFDTDSFFCTPADPVSEVVGNHPLEAKWKMAGTH